MRTTKNSRRRTEEEAKKPVGRPAAAPDLTTERGRIGAGIRAARLAAELSVRDAARRAMLSETKWYDYEQGRALPPLPVVPRICDALGCSLGAIIPEGD